MIVGDESIKMRFSLFYFNKDWSSNSKIVEIRKWSQYKVDEVDKNQFHNKFEIWRLTFGVNQSYSAHKYYSCKVDHCCM
jgi:hypothetical protein